MQHRTILLLAAAAFMLVVGRVGCSLSIKSEASTPVERSVAAPVGLEAHPLVLAGETRSPVRATAPGETPKEPEDGGQVEALRREIAQLRFDLLVCRTPEASPLGALLRLPEAQHLTSEQLAVLKDTLELYPVALLPGEGAWLADQMVTIDGLPRPVIPDEVFVRFIGAPRVLKALGPDGLERLRAQLGEATISRLFP